MSGLLNIAGGLAAVYVILALITAHFAEAISALVNKRGRALFAGLGLFLGGNALPGVANLVDDLYSQPLINGTDAKRRKPSYIATRTLTLSLLQVLKGKAAAFRVPPVSATASTDLFTDLQADLSLLAAKGGAVGNVAGSLLVSLQTTRADYQSALKSVDDWFESQMDQISGSYARWSAVVQLVIAAAVVAILNADTFAIVEQLSRSAVVAGALASVNPGAETALSDQLKSFADNGLKLGWSASSINIMDGLGVLRKIGGLLTTWAAVLLGAPFWFNLLKQFIPVRLTGTRPNDDK